MQSAGAVPTQALSFQKLFLHPSQTDTPQKGTKQVAGDQAAQTQYDHVHLAQLKFVAPQKYQKRGNLHQAAPTPNRTQSYVYGLI